MFLEIIKETPWWVYLIFIFLVLIGLRATQSRTISLNRLFFLPILFTVWNISWLAERLKGHVDFLLFWPIALSAGIFFGWLTVRKWKISIDRSRKLITLPPNWSTLLLILSVFIVRYFFIFKYETHPNEIPEIFLADSLISGILTGTFIGRSLSLFQKYKSESLN